VVGSSCLLPFTVIFFCSTEIRDRLLFVRILLPFKGKQCLPNSLCQSVISGYVNVSTSTFWLLSSSFIFTRPYYLQARRALTRRTHLSQQQTKAHDNSHVSRFLWQNLLVQSRSHYSLPTKSLLPLRRSQIVSKSSP
jgi:hypothetical protein